jgi:D-aminopeptidase
LEVRYFHTDTADAKMSQPDVKRVDSQTIRVEGDDILEIIYR